MAMKNYPPIIYQKIVEYHKEGKTNPEIAKLLGISRSWVYKHLISKGFIIKGTYGRKFKQRVDEQEVGKPLPRFKNSRNRRRGKEPSRF